MSNGPFTIYHREGGLPQFMNFIYNRSTGSIAGLEYPSAAMRDEMYTKLLENTNRPAYVEVFRGAMKYGEGKPEITLENDTS